MSENLKLIRIFIGSPGGLEEERQAAHEVVNSVNLSHSERWGVLFKLLGWEDAVPGYARPQSKINEDLDRCSYFLGVLWNHWGSRPSSEPGGYTSGFEEEYYRAEDRVKSGHMQDMAVYFKSIDIPAGMQPGPSVKKVLDFRQKCINEKKIFFKEFSDTQAFKELVRAKLEEIGWRETPLVGGGAAQQEQPSKNIQLLDERDKAVVSDGWLIDEAARNFITELTRRPPDWDSTSAAEIARLRLITSSVIRSGNDDFHIGNHDANLVYQFYRDSHLSKQEIGALIDCGVAGFQHQNVPLWCWIAEAEKEGAGWERVNFLAIVGDEIERRNSIKILEIASQPIPSLEGHFTRERVVAAWLSDDTPTSIVESAVGFLASDPEGLDLLWLEEIAAQAAPSRKQKIEGAIVSVLSRTNPDAALNRLADKEVDRLSGDVLERLFSNPLTLKTETLNRCLSAKSDAVRLAAARLLLARDAIPRESAETLLTDSNYETRLIAAERLKQLGAELSEEVARKALRVVRSTGSLFLSISASDGAADESYYDRYVANRLSELDFAGLSLKVKFAGAFDEPELSALYKKFANKMVEEIRNNLKDRFKRHFDEQVRFGRELGIIDSDRERRIRDLEEFSRQRLCSTVVSILAELGKPEDLPLIREVLDTTPVDGSESLLNYFGRFGTWDDVERVDALGRQSVSQAGLLALTTTKLPEQKARAILQLAKARIADLLELKLDGRIRTAIARKLPKAVIRELSDHVILQQLEDDSEEYRVIFAQRCVQSFAKSRINSLLKQYVDGGDHRFYNSVHWLDLGSALPSRLAKTVAERALASQAI